MRIPKGMGYYIKYLNNILKCMDTSIIEGYSKKMLDDSSSLNDIMSVASDIDDLSFLESIFTAGSGGFLFFNSLDFLHDSIYSSHRERLENTIKDKELCQKIISCCGSLLDGDVEVIGLDGSYNISSFDDSEGFSIESMEDSDSYKSTVDSVNNIIEFSSDDDDDFDDEYDEDDSEDVTDDIYDVDDSDFDEDDDYEDVNDSDSDSEDILVESIYDSAFFDDDEEEIEEDEEEDATEDSNIDSIYDSAFNDLEDSDDDDDDNFSIPADFFSSLEVSSSSDSNSSVFDDDDDDDDSADSESDDAYSKTEEFETDIDENYEDLLGDIESQGLKETNDFDNNDFNDGESFEESKNSKNLGEMNANFGDNESKQVDDDLFSLESKKDKTSDLSLDVDNSLVSMDGNSINSFESDSIETFEDYVDDDVDEDYSEDDGEDDFESLVSGGIDDDNLILSTDSDNDFSSIESLESVGNVQKTFDDSLADSIVKIAELFNKDKRSEVARKVKSFIEDHRVTSDDDEY